MRRLPPRSTRTDTLFPYTTLFRSYDADVHDNVATKNSGGILVFDLPSLPQQGGHNVRVFDNMVHDNSTPNFAPKGNIVASVPTGPGVRVMANSRVADFDNMLADQGTANVMIVGRSEERRVGKEGIITC